PHVAKAGVQDLAARDAGATEYRRHEQVRGCALLKHIETLVVCRWVVSVFHEPGRDIGERVAMTCRPGTCKSVRLRLCDALKLRRSLQRLEVLALASLVDQAQERCPKIGYRAGTVREELIAVRADGEPSDSGAAMRCRCENGERESDGRDGAEPEFAQRVCS